MKYESSESMYTHHKKNNWFGKYFVRNGFQGHDMESWYQNIVPSQVVWTGHRYITPRLSPVSYKWKWAGAVAQGLLYSLGYWSSDLLPVPKKFMEWLVKEWSDEPTKGHVDGLTDRLTSHE